MENQEDSDLEAMDTAPSPLTDYPEITETALPEVITIKEEQLEACELVERTQLTETEQQIQDIMEENDRSGFEADLDKYLKTDTSDKAAIHAMVQKNRSNVVPYESAGFAVIEFFPKKDWIGYYMVVDGHRLSRNSKRNGCLIFRCRYQDQGCNARYKIVDGNISKANRHHHPASMRALRRYEGDNKHFTCIYCNEKFTDLEKRKAHILNEPHFNAPWPMDEDLCIFAEYTKDPSNSPEYAEDAMDMPESVYTIKPNREIENRIVIQEDNELVILRPGEKNFPIYPKPQPYPYTPKNTPGRSKKKGYPLNLITSCHSPTLSEPNSQDISDNSVVKIRNSNAKNDEKVRRSGRAKDKIRNYATDSLIDQPVAEKNKRLKEIEHKTTLVPKKRRHKDDEVRSVPQRIDNVIEEYENKVVLHCDLCDVKLNSLKHRADHNMSEEHQENKRLIIEENARCRASLAFNKPIFTDDFLIYNKALEAELRSLRKGAVELEEQNAVLSSHINELTDVVKELRNAKAIMQRQHTTLDLHLRDLKSELSKVFANVLSTEVSSENFNETFNKLSVAITSKNGNKRSHSDGITTKLKRHLKQARIDSVAL